MSSRYDGRLLLLVAVGVAAFLATAATAADVPEEPAYDPEIAAMLEEIDGTELYRTTRDLQNFPTRAFGTDGNREAGGYLYRRLAEIPGLSVEFQGGDLRNVVATLPGSGNASDGVVVVGAHYDSTSSDPARAPGAADNGCGVAIVLELARVMSERSFDRTVEFAFWNAEEIGLVGSRRYVGAAADRESEILLYLNYDSACGEPGGPPVANVLYNKEAHEAAVLAAHHNTIYGINLTLTRKPGSHVSDHTPFWAAGYPAMMTHAPPQQSAHTPDDTIDRISFPYAVKNARLGLSVLAKAADAEGGIATRWTVLHTAPDWSRLFTIAGCDYPGTLAAGSPRLLQGPGLLMLPGVAVSTPPGSAAGVSYY
ncbi:Zn-dependent exopeptidase M28 [Methanoculleus sp. Wushi-C6]|uniref:Zn-dependent exopeptidase M28 n=1 Tax=Methanoculleus caldifontis TaxID=2651577 RepID=A0ABU3WYJ3_9EURY|nr:M28 family metallopeptidase [Methanoculleus sp. Wushi-C6]MDV2480864.1 Zn-dependent exopeptidase M28 [Methanoculleus sp. Wushi-C6]